MCLATNPKVLLLDEPLAGMGAEETDRMFEILMGEDVPDRRAFIERHAKEVTNLDI